METEIQSKADLSEQDVMNIFEDSGALLNGHFLLTSGKHSARYMQCAQVLQYPHHAARLGEELAKQFANLGVQTVIGPAMGGILVAHEVGKALGTRALFTEREDGKMRLRRGFQLTKGEMVLVVEDVITTGGSVKEVLQVVLEAEAIPVGVGVLVDRSGGKADFGVPLQSLLKIQIETFEASDCPLCKEGLPCIKPGSRKA